MAEKIWTRINKTCQEKDQFLRLLWFDAWSRYISENNNWQGELIYEEVSGDGTDEAIIPYAFQTIGPFHFASLAGNYFPHRGIPYTGSGADLIKNTINKISKIKDISGFRLGPVVQDDEFNLALECAFLKNNWKIIKKGIGQDFGLELPTSEEEFLALINGKKKKKIRYLWRLMMRKGKAEIKHYNDLSIDKWTKVFEELAIVENNAWIKEGGEPRFIGDANQYFWNSLTADKWYRRAVNVWIMYLNEEPVSYAIALDTENTRYSLASSYDEKVSYFGTGNKINMELVTQAIKVGIKYLNDGMGDSGYKSGWGSQKISDLVDIVAFPPTLKGRLAYYAAVLKEKLQRN